MMKRICRLMILLVAYQVSLMTAAQATYPLEDKIREPSNSNSLRNDVFCRAYEDLL